MFLKRLDKEISILRGSNEQKCDNRMMHKNASNYSWNGKSEQIPSIDFNGGRAKYNKCIKYTLAPQTHVRDACVYGFVLNISCGQNHSTNTQALQNAYHPFLFAFVHMHNCFFSFFFASNVYRIRFCNAMCM